MPTPDHQGSADRNDDDRPLNESNLVHMLLLKYEHRSPMARLWRVNGLNVKLGGTWIRSVKRGHPDLCGYVKGTGRLLMVECKSDTGRLSREQESWRWMLESDGPLYVLARRLADVDDAVTAAFEPNKKRDPLVGFSLPSGTKQT